MNRYQACIVTMVTMIFFTIGGIEDFAIDLIDGSLRICIFVMVCVLVALVYEYKEIEGEEDV